MELPDWDIAAESSTILKQRQESQEESGRYRCFLIESRERPRFLNSYGAPIAPKRLREEQFDYDERLALANSKISSTDSRRSYFTKLSIHESKPGELELGFEALSSLKKKLNEERNRPLYWEEIPKEHCTICYYSDHFRESCDRCGWCRRKGHFKQQCPWNSQEERAVLSVTRQGTPKNKPWKKEFLRERDISAWWKHPGRVHSFWLDMMKPIGPSGKEKLTLAIDTEGGAANVHVSAWVNGTFGVETVYFDTIKLDPTKKSTCTPISGVQEPELLRGTPLEKVRENILKIANNKRLLMHGGNDLSSLGITSQDVKENNIEILDTATLFIDSNLHPIGLETHDKFWYNGKKLQRNSWVHPINGHSPERDSRLTLLIYKNYVNSPTVYGTRPNGSDIRKAKNNNYNLENWKNDHVKQKK